MEKIFSDIIESFNRIDKKKEQAFPKSRVVLKNSKKSISKVHNDDLKSAAELLKEAWEIFNRLQEMVNKSVKIKYEGYFQEAMEEFVEALLFYNFSKNSKVFLEKEILDFFKDTPEILIGGFCDFTGELQRRAVRIASRENMDKLEQFHKVSGKVIENLLEMDLKGGSRHKFDQAKRNVKNLEMMLYDLKVKNS
ncbi:MAG: hypothetical protein GF335_03395 [Candidatus Moranbacteria bacterium]|nr:hypothetical protein [Candidatus Moranbacteria bacterium]